MYVLQKFNRNTYNQCNEIIDDVSKTPAILISLNSLEEKLKSQHFPLSTVGDKICKIKYNIPLKR